MYCISTYTNRDILARVNYWNLARMPYIIIPSCTATILGILIPICLTYVFVLSKSNNLF